jgi:hypothetical protein
VIEPATLRLEFASFDHWLAGFAAVNPPLMAMREILSPAAYEGLIRDAWALAEEVNQADSGVVLDSAYLGVTARRPPA